MSSIVYRELELHEAPLLATIAFGAWDEQRLVGVGSLDASGVGGDGAVMKLDMLYVDAGYRGRGVGRRLTDMLASDARARGATGLYISATPTRRTVDAYLSMGATVLVSPIQKCWRANRTTFISC